MSRQSTTATPSLFRLSKDFRIDFASGYSSGIVTGALVAVPEYMKVLFQSKSSLSWAEFASPAFLRKEGPKLLKTIPTFSGMFGMTCGIEFSVNTRINEKYTEKYGKQYGEMAGLVASSVTGAAFLTPADHLMYRQHVGQNTLTALRSMSARPHHLFTGYTPMLGREFFFMASVAKFGPQFGKKLHSTFGNDNASKNEDYFWNYTGRLLSGFIFTALSQPCDALTRQMQIQRYNKPSNPASMVALLGLMITNKTLFAGFLPRLGLASFGGSTAAHFFDYFRDKINQPSCTLFAKKTESDESKHMTNKGNCQNSK